MADRDPDLTGADRRAIDAIRRELDAEFGPLEDAAPLDLGSDDRDDDAALPDPRDADSDDAADVLVDRDGGCEWSSRPGVVAAFVAGILLGALLGGAATFAWLHGDRGLTADATRAASAPGPAAPDASASPPSAALPARENRPAAAPSVGLDAASLREAVDEWLDATTRGDIPAQMRFYPRRVPVYYTWRDVPREAVRAEKQKVFGEATRLAITTSRPTLDVARDGGSAVTRFRKRYVIEGPAVHRKGEVLQELRWERTERGWVIVSERDARVLAAE
jgi:hypothetical protein